MNPNKLIEEVDNFSDHKLKRKDDLKTLYKISSANGEVKKFEALSFTAKYILGLQRVLKQGSMNPEIGNLGKIKQDYSDNLKKVIDQIKEFVSLTNNDTTAHFDKTYIELSHQSLNNLIELLEDLEWTKKYLNTQKRQSKN